MFRMVFIILDRIRNGKTYSVDSDSFPDFVRRHEEFTWRYLYLSVLELTGCSSPEQINFE